MSLRFAYRQRVDPGGWFQYERVYRRDFQKEVIQFGCPAEVAEKEIRVVGLRADPNGSRDEHGRLLVNVDCDLADPFLHFVEMRIDWTADGA